MTSTGPSSVTIDVVQGWLTARLARGLRIEESQIEASTTFAELGLSSLRAVELVAELEDEFDVELPSTLIYDYPTLNSVAPFIASLVDGRPS